MAEFELVLLLLGELCAILAIARLPAIRLPWSWFASIVLVRLAVVIPQALTLVSWQPWLLVAAIIGLVGAWVTLLLLWYWVLQGKVLRVPPGTPPLFHVFVGGMVLSFMSTGDLPVPPWISLPLALNGLLMSLLFLVWVLKIGRRTKQAQNQSEAGSAS